MAFGMSLRNYRLYRLMRLEKLKIKWRREVPALPMIAGDAFKGPFGYGKVGKLHNKFAYEYYLFPFYLFIRFWRWLQRQKYRMSSRYPKAR